MPTQPFRPEAVLPRLSRECNIKVNITQSMSKAGCPYDNAPMERFYNTFKSNFYNITSFSNVEMKDELTMKYINWYNYVRPH